MILKKRTPGAGLPPPRGNIQVYYHNNQRSFSLKLLGQSKSNVLLSILRENERLYKWSRSQTFKNLPLQNQKAFDFENWPEASMNTALQSLYKS